MSSDIAPSGSALSDSGPLYSAYDELLLDLDGTLYRGPDAIPGAVAALADLPTRLLYVTNNASRSPRDVAEHLTELGFAASDSDVVTSAQAAARLLAQRFSAGAIVLVVGAQALVDEVAAVGLVPVREFDAERPPVAAVHGHSPDTGWRLLAEETLAIRADAWWVATNIDSTLPTERGLVLGNGSMVAAVRHATGAEPVVAGKPARPLMLDAQERNGAQRPLVVGDRLDTDIEGANAVGFDSLLVLTGVSTPADVLRAVPEQRPTFIADELAALRSPAAQCRVLAPDVNSAHPMSYDSGVLTVGTAVDGRVDHARLVRDVAVVAWQHSEFERVTSNDPEVADILSRWKL
ncbi:MAG: HAD-IIA family hydrolase [Rhodococcus sp.]|nr:HAD-IIA family hydrolase [Rhodococcus sp. (in: high G+C Gram-positive bacteria)]